jgi:hypothetical protein
MSIISRWRWRATLTLGAAATAVLALALPAGASTGLAQISPQQAGYSATNAQLKTITATVYLRQPAQYLDEVLSVAHSVQLWSSAVVVTLGLRASTSGGGYTTYATIYDRNTHQVIASDPNAENCPNGLDNDCFPGPATWDPGQTASMRISYTPANGHLFMLEVNGDGGVFDSSYDLSHTQSFTQARVGTEFGASPWDAPLVHNPPPSYLKIATYNHVSLTSYGGHTATLWSWWVHHKLLANTGQQSDTDWIAVPTDLYNGGASFQTWFVPQSAQSPHTPTAP